MSLILDMYALLFLWKLFRALSKGLRITVVLLFS